MDDLNEDQKKAVMHIDGPMMVLAGPGSGKTFVITRRLQYLIENGGINPAEILVITFTKAAAYEMQQRFEKLMGDKYYPVRFGTFHAVYFSILKSGLGRRIPGLVSEGEKKKYINDIIFDFDKDISDSLENCEENILADISKIKNWVNKAEEYCPDYIDGKIFNEIFRRYEEIMKTENKIDFDDMVCKCYKLLTDNPAVLEECRNIFKYIMIDEFQDINPIQYEVIKLIAAPLNNLFIVGDDDQAIYGFRGAKPEIMLNFNNEFPEAKQVILSNNYRSKALIVDMSKEFIKFNKMRFDKDFSAVNKSKCVVSLNEYDNKNEEFDAIQKFIKTSLKIGNYKDVAILFRTNTAASVMTKMLFDADIPFRYKEKLKSIFDNDITRDIIAMLKFARGENTRKNILRFINRPVRYIPRNAFVHEIVDFNEILNGDNIGFKLQNNIKRLKYDMEQIKEMDLYCAINYIRKGTGYEYFALNNLAGTEEEKQYYKDVMDLLQKTASKCNSIVELVGCIEKYEKNLSAYDSDMDDVDAVNVLTMHGSKGLEYKNVIIPGLNEGYMPHGKNEKEKEIEEERRVLYVAMTRAKDNLFISYIKKNKTNRQGPSRFVYEIKSYNNSSNS